jgi:predicted CoA-substrate-specific enzyme activase
MYFAGVDVGSATTKAVIVDDDSRTVGHALFPSGSNLAAAATKALGAAIEEARISPDQVSTVISTGYGRESVKGNAKTVTEITCHARGVSSQNSAARLVIDIGGQDSKAIALGADGTVQNFGMNDKCAAGTGRFLEVMARVLEIDLTEIGDLALTADAPAKISSTCTVFAESEVVSLLAQGESLPRILAGICNSIAERVKSMASRVGIHPEVVMTGGVALNIGVVKSIERVFGHPVSVPDEPQMTGALGAALIARDFGANDTL